MAPECQYYRVTSHGARCVLMSIGDWRIHGRRYLPYCRNGGKGCSVLAAFERKVGKNKKFLADVRKNALWENRG